MKCSLGISNFLEEISSLSILLFSSISLHWLLRKAFLSLLSILWNSAFKWVYLSFSPLLFTSLLFIAIFKATSDNHVAFLYFFFLGMVLILISCTMSQNSIHDILRTGLKKNFNNLVSSWWIFNLIFFSYVCALHYFSSVWLCVTHGLQSPALLSLGFSRQKHWSGLLCPPQYFSHKTFIQKQCTRLAKKKIAFGNQNQLLSQIWFSSVLMVFRQQLVSYNT